MDATPSHRDTGDETPDYHAPLIRWSPEHDHQHPCQHAATVPLFDGERLCLFCRAIGAER